MQSAIDRARFFVGWTLFVVLIAATLALGGNRPVTWTLMTLVVIGLFALTLLLDRIRKPPRIMSRLWLPALLFLGALLWGLLQTLPAPLPADWAHPVWQFVPDSPPRLSADPAQGWHVLMRLSAYAMVFWIALRCAEDPEAALRQIKAFALFSIALAAFGIFAVASGSNPIVGERGTGVVSASFVNRNSYATFAGFGLIACLALLLRSMTRAQGGRDSTLAGVLRGLVSGGWVWLAGLTLCGGAIMLSQSRGGAAAAVVGVLILLSTHRQRGGAASIGPTLVAGAIVLAILASGATGTLNRMVTSSDENGRFAVYPAVIEAIAERPLLGNGIGAFHTAFRAHLPVEAASGEWDMAHNSYLENAFELGLPAAFAFYLALGLIGLQLLRGLQARKRNRSVVAVALACFFLGGFHALFDFSLQMPATAAFFAWLLGLGYAQSFPGGALKDGPG